MSRMTNLHMTMPNKKLPDFGASGESSKLGVSGPTFASTQNMGTSRGFKDSIVRGIVSGTGMFLKY